MVTPGIVMGENLVAGKENTFLAAVYFAKSTTGIAFLDLSTGEFYVAEGDDRYIDKLLATDAFSEGRMSAQQIVDFYAPQRERYVKRKEKYHLYE
jgi:DNA mismatch repair ATPase MutS